MNCYYCIANLLHVQGGINGERARELCDELRQSGTCPYARDVVLAAMRLAAGRGAWLPAPAPDTRYIGEHQ